MSRYYNNTKGVARKARLVKGGKAAPKKKSAMDKKKISTKEAKSLINKQAKAWNWKHNLKKHKKAGRGNYGA